MARYQPRVDVGALLVASASPARSPQGGERLCSPLAMWRREREVAEEVHVRSGSCARSAGSPGAGWLAALHCSR